ncbi:MAG TPA: hypothetical protein PLO51_03310 [Candidatus Micrarchaeota archaeon]|nr:hypothetical protein [Candidatus Micrarchaeota archaeon]
MEHKGIAWDKVAFTLALLALAVLPGAAYSQGPLVSTSWQGYSVLAFLISVFVLALTYMAGYLLNSNELKIMAHDELYQAMATAVMIGLFVSVLAWVNTSFSPGLATAGGQGGQTLLDGATAFNDGLIDSTVSNYHSYLEKLVKDLGSESSKSAYCSFLGAGMNVVICSSMNSVRGTLSLAYNAVSFALADLYAQSWILRISNTMLLAVLLPMGIFFRSFKFSRAAGGALIAVTIGFYLIFPACVLFGDMLVRTISCSTCSYAYLAAPPDAITVPRCNPFDPSDSAIMGFFSSVMKDNHFYEPILFHVIIRCVLMTVFSILVTLTAIRSMAQYLGAEIEVSGLVRLA